MTDDNTIHRQLIRMHGLSLMYMILTELSEERDLVLLVSRTVSLACRFEGSDEAGAAKYVDLEAVTTQ